MPPRPENGRGARRAGSSKTIERPHRAAAPGGDARRWAAADYRRRGQREDARHHAAGGVSHQPGNSRRVDPGDHVHQQSRRRDEELA